MPTTQRFAIPPNSTEVVITNPDFIVEFVVPETTSTTTTSSTTSSTTSTSTTTKTPDTTTTSTTTQPTAGYTLTYSNGFDKQADLDPDGHGQIGNGGLSTTIFKTGPGSFRSIPANVSSGIRSEVQFDDSRTSVEGAIEYDVMYVKIQANNCHSFQFHPNTSGGSASPGLWHIDGQFVWVNWKGGTNTKYPTGITIPANKWMHIRVEYKFGSAGYLKFYIDGVLTLNKTGIQAGDGSGQYLKVGFNSWSGSTSEIYYDNLKIYKKN